MVNIDDGLMSSVCLLGVVFFSVVMVMCLFVLIFCLMMIVLVSLLWLNLVKWCVVVLIELLVGKLMRRCGGWLFWVWVVSGRVVSEVRRWCWLIMVWVFLVCGWWWCLVWCVMWCFGKCFVWCFLWWLFRLGVLGWF